MTLFGGYECKTTFWNDFEIAERFGEDAMIGTFNIAFRFWKNNYIYLTELVMVMNHKLWYWYEKKHDHPYVELYNVFYDKSSRYAEENLKGDELSYYYRTTD